MQAFHTNWTRPFFARQPGADYDIPDFDLLTTILSAMNWRRHNGSIAMITDSIGADYYRRLGLDILWDGGLSTQLDDIPDSIDPITFWAVGKLAGLAACPAPCVMMDTDFIVWKTVEYVVNSQVAVIHREDLNAGIYPPKERFIMAENYEFPAGLDWNAPACNTAFAYFSDEEFKTAYVEEAIRFINAVRERDNLIYMVFAEQRLLAMCAPAFGVTIDSISDVHTLFNREQNTFTHTWGFKQQMLQSSAYRERFCRQCAERINRDFPQLAPVCRNIESLRGYFEEK